MNATKLVSLLLGFVLAFAIGAQPAGADETTGAFIMTLETDKSVYQLGEWVDILFRLDNSSLATFSIDCFQDPGWDIWVYLNPDDLSFGELYDAQAPVWQAVHMWADIGWTWTFQPGDVFEQPLSWDMTDNDGLPVSPGEYEVFGLVVCSGISSTPYGAEIDGTQFQKHITIVPEPGAIVLLCSAVPLMVRRTRRLTGRR